jgi:hypothetical protein
MADLEQFTADPNAAPTRILSRHPQDQLAKALLQPRPTHAAAAAEGCPLPAHQLAMPTEDCFRLDQSAQTGTGDQAVEGGDDHPVARGQLRAFDLPA